MVTPLPHEELSPRTPMKARAPSPKPTSAWVGRFSAAGTPGMWT